MNKRMSALKFALENEQKEREFYLANARRTKNLAGKNMFKQIAEEEKEHYEMLKKLFSAWEGKSKWPETISLKTKKSLASHILKSMADKKAAYIKGNDDDLKAVRTAIDFEARGMALYTKLEEGSADPKEKAFFNLLAGIERQHFMSLRDTEEFLMDPASWYQKTERASLDGG
ncbi:MAG TPA: ferritin family protein [Smithella sp.]|nr:ferritin family protein [Smithella sp.]HRS98352.1 ferritin family protein [Smithella sp.]